MSPILNLPLSATPNQPRVPFYKELSCWLVNFVCQKQVFRSEGIWHQQPAYESVDLGEISDDRTVEQLLEYAKQKLSTPQMPHFMRITVYLRFCCLAIHKSLSEEHQALVSNFYHDLLQWLWECEPDWWEQCFITDAGRIASCNVRIQNLLQPLEDFVSQFSEG